MKYYLQILVILTALLGIHTSTVNASIPKGVVEVEMQHRYSPGRLGKRSFKNVYGSYSIIFGAGTPPQEQAAILDTGSSDLWLNGPDSSQSLYYDHSNSSTYHYNNSDFSIRYGSGSAQGDWITETLSIAGSKLKNQSLGLVNNPSAGEAVFGVGMIDNESSNVTYVNVPQNLKDQGLIEHNAYSMFLDNYTTTTGRILFGGIDEKKFNGSLKVVKLTSDRSFNVNLDSIAVGNQNIDSLNLSVLLDTGTTFCYLPMSLGTQIANIYGATFDNSSGLFFMSESNSSQPDVTFRIGGVEITVPQSEMVIESSVIVPDEDSVGPYVLGIVPSDDSPFILGDTFLRSAYIVFDIENLQVALAQANFNPQSHIVAIPAGKLIDAVGSDDEGLVSTPYSSRFSSSLLGSSFVQDVQQSTLLTKPMMVSTSDSQSILTVDSDEEKELTDSESGPESNLDNDSFLYPGIFPTEHIQFSFASTAIFKIVKTEHIQQVTVTHTVVMTPPTVTVTKNLT